MTPELLRCARSESQPSFAGYVGMSRRDMTPAAGIYCHNWGAARHVVADSIHRPLYVYAMAVKSAADAPPVVVLTIDYSWFLSQGTVHELRRPLLAEHGLQEHQLLFILSHSHSVPHIDHELEHLPGGDKIPAYRDKLKGALQRAVGEALGGMAPATMSWTSAACDVVRKRDFVDPDSGRILCGPNPSGVADTTLLVGRVARPDGSVLGTLVNYACHPVCLGAGNTTVSPDYIGALRDVMERHTEGAPCMFIHGASGDQTPRDSYASSPSVADRNGEAVGYAALGALHSMLPPGRRLEFVEVVESGAPLAVFAARPYGLDREVRSAVALTKLPGRDWPGIDVIEARILQATSDPERVRMERLHKYVQNLEALADGFPVWAMRLGQALIIGTPAEPFSQFQSELRRRFPQNAVIVANDANGSFNYLPPAVYYGNGAYEQESADFGPGSLELVTEAAAGLIGRLLEPSGGVACPSADAVPQAAHRT